MGSVSIDRYLIGHIIDFNIFYGFSSYCLTIDSH